MLSSTAQVIFCLVSYADWWQPATASVIQVGAARRKKDLPEGFRAGLVETLDERTELRRRIARLEQFDRRILFLSYVKQLAAAEAARSIGLSTRQYFRRRAKAIKYIVDLGGGETN